MKKSNKLLIAFGLTLILLPIISMAIISRVYMEQGDYRQNRENGSAALNAPTRGMKTLQMPIPFTKVNIEGDNQLAIIVEIIKDDKYGVKIADDTKDQFTPEVDENGQLNIVVKKPLKEENNFGRIIIYAPNVKALNVVNANSLNVRAKLDSLQLNITNSQSVWIEGDGLIKKLVATTTKVGGFGISDGTVASAVLNLNSASFTSRSNNMDYLKITTKGNSEINIQDEHRDDQPDKVIKNLVLNTLGKTNVKISGVKINNCSGSFSDSTQVEMPAVNLNQMYKMKK